MVATTVKNKPSSGSNKHITTRPYQAYPAFALLRKGLDVYPFISISVNNGNCRPKIRYTGAEGFLDFGEIPMCRLTRVSRKFRSDYRCLPSPRMHVRNRSLLLDCDKEMELLSVTEVNVIALLK
jgi:hypothetical protein